MKLIAIKADTQAKGEFMFDAAESAAHAERFPIEDYAFVYRKGNKVEVKDHKGKVGRMFGTHIDKGQIKRIAEAGQADDSFVFVLAEDNVADAIGVRVRTVMGDDLKTYEVDGETLTETTGTDPTYALAADNAALGEDADMIPRTNTLLTRIPIS
jgi:hypothetical protein